MIKLYRAVGQLMGPRRSGNRSLDEASRDATGASCQSKLPPCFATPRESIGCCEWGRFLPQIGRSSITKVRGQPSPLFTFHPALAQPTPWTSGRWTAASRPLLAGTANEMSATVAATAAHFQVEPFIEKVGAIANKVGQIKSFRKQCQFVPKSQEVRKTFSADVSSFRIVENDFGKTAYFNYLVIHILSQRNNTHFFKKWFGLISYFPYYFQ